MKKHNRRKQNLDFDDIEALSDEEIIMLYDDFLEGNGDRIPECGCTDPVYGGIRHWLCGPCNGGCQLGLASAYDCYTWCRGHGFITVQGYYYYWNYNCFCGKAPYYSYVHGSWNCPKD